jgi:hypothetical protein
VVHKNHTHSPRDTGDGSGWSSSKEHENNPVGKSDAMSGSRETPIATRPQTERPQPTQASAGAPVCTHSRLIDGILTGSGEPTGKVRCLECLAIFDDPDQGQQ